MKKITRPYLRAFLRSHSTDGRVLDIGGGRVSTNHSYSEIFPNRFSVDIDPERKPDVVGDAHSLPVEDSSFDVVLCTEVLEHLHTPQKAIDEMYRVLKPGGKLILTTRFMYPLHDVPHDYFRYTLFGLKHLFKNWSNVEVLPETKSFVALAAVLQRIIFQTDLRGGKFTKLIIWFLVCIVKKSEWLIKKEYGDIKKTQEISPFITTGYYVVANKPTS